MDGCKWLVFIISKLRNIKILCGFDFPIILRYFLKIYCDTYLLRTVKDNYIEYTVSTKDLITRYGHHVVDSKYT